MKTRVALLCLLAVGLGLQGAPRALAAAPPSGKPSIFFTSPRDGATITGGTINVRTEIKNFKLVPPVLVPPAQWKNIPLLKGNQGHLHYLLDSIASLVLTRDVTTMLSHTWTNVSPGRHTLIAYLATSQHAPFPGVQKAVLHVTVVEPRARSHARVQPATRKSMAKLPRTGGAVVSSHGASPASILLIGLAALLGFVLLLLGGRARFTGTRE